MSPFLARIEAMRLEEHEASLTSTRGAEVISEPRAKRGTSTDNYRTRAQAAADKAETLRLRLAAIERGRATGLSGRELARAAGITERQLYWLESQKRKAESSRSQVTR